MISVIIGLIFLEMGKTEPSETIKTTYICPKDFHPVGEKCYHFGTDKVMWLDSHFYCQILNSSLAIINSYREQHLLRDFLANNTKNVSSGGDRWIDGIYDWQQRRWKWGASGATISFNMFSKKNVGDEFKWYCVSLNGLKRNRWTARKCTEKKEFVCETDTNVFVQFRLEKKRKKFEISKCNGGKRLNQYERRRCAKMLGNDGANEPAEYAFRPRQKGTRGVDDPDGWVCPPYMVGLGNKCYHFSKVETTWQEAYFECRNNKTKLAIVRNKAQDHNLRRFLNNFIEKFDRWIGAIYDWKTPQWKWAITGQPLSYFGFSKEAIKERSSKDLAWNGIFMDPNLDNQWNVAKQTEKKRFICQVKAKAVKNFGNVRLKPKATIARSPTNNY